MVPQTEEAPSGQVPEPSWSDPQLIICAWCEQFGHNMTGARLPNSHEWYSVSHEAARAWKRTDSASHGVCDECSALLRSDWGLTTEETRRGAA